MNSNNPLKEKKMKNEEISDRRKFFLTMARAAGLAALGGLMWSAYVDEVTASQLTLRPPGALDEKDFLKTCIKCGMCVEACPYDTLKLANRETTNLWELLFLNQERLHVICVQIYLVFLFVRQMP